VHVSYEAQIVLELGCLAYRLPPFLYQLEDLALNTGRMHRRALWKSADELIEKLFGTDLEVECIAAVLDAYV
jgi:hypothetical protein